MRLALEILYVVFILYLCDFLQLVEWWCLCSTCDAHGLGLVLGLVYNVFRLLERDYYMSARNFMYREEVWSNLLDGDRIGV